MTWVQAEKAYKSRHWVEAEKLYVEALWIDASADAVNAPLWLGYCKACLGGGNGEEALKAADVLAGLRAGDAEPRVLKVKGAHPIAAPCLPSVLAGGNVREFCRGTLQCPRAGAHARASSFRLGLMSHIDQAGDAELCARCCCQQHA